MDTFTINKKKTFKRIVKYYNIKKKKLTFPFVKAVAVSLIQVGRKKGVRATGVLFIYWVLHLLCAGVILRSMIIAFIKDVSVQYPPGCMVIVRFT